jgi:hypothetical protein
MMNLKEVENANALMREAFNSSVVKWLAEKKKVRKAADLANSTLDALDKEVKAAWNNELKAAYNGVSPSGSGPESGRKSKEKVKDISPEIQLLAKAIKQADEEAYRLWHSTNSGQIDYIIPIWNYAQSMRLRGTT